MCEVGDEVRADSLASNKYEMVISWAVVELCYGLSGGCLEECERQEYRLAWISFTESECINGLAMPPATGGGGDPSGAAGELA